MSKKSFNYIFVDESGDPGRPYKIDDKGNKIPTGASLFYILSAVCLDSKKLFLLEKRMMEVKNKYGYRNEIKSDTIPLILYKALLKIINELDIKTYYRLIDKRKYKGQFAVDGKRKLHNIFDEYNLAKLVYFATKQCNFLNAEVIIDRADRRLLDNKFDNFNNYLKKRINTKTIKRIEYITHVNSEYVNAMQMSDLISGAIKDHFTKRNIDLKKVIRRSLLKKIF
ncbi:MAG: DUF3800 domain-containing protein [Candidatus Portnoybacteria bacterium]|nr:DUF3800 domain-containing protein [Candidatus Portnoybacteria bacterium]